MPDLPTAARAGGEAPACPNAPDGGCVTNGTNEYSLCAWCGKPMPVSGTTTLQYSAVGASWLTEIGRRESLEGKVMRAEWFSSVPPARAGADAPPGDEALDAARWRALMNAGRIRVLGSAGMGGDSDFRHLGVELWTSYPVNGELLGRQHGRDLLTEFADCIRRATLSSEATP